MKVTAIRQQVKNPSRASVYLDDRYVFSLSLDDLVSARLKVGQELSADQVQEYKQLSASGKLRQRTLEWLFIRPRSEHELRLYLKRKQAAPDEIDTLVAYSQHRRYQNDHAFAVWLVEVRRRRGKSERVIRAELNAERIDQTIIGEVLETDEADEGVRLRDVLKKKAHLARYQDRTKLSRYLASLGFSYTDIKDAIKELDSAEDS